METISTKTAKLAKKARKKERKKLKNQIMKVDYSFIKILTGSDLSTRKLALMSVKSVNPGPVIWFTGCSHGDEVGGIVVIQEVIKKVIKKGLLKGSIYAFPLMNPIGFETASRNIALSKEDLNRSFPGNANGSLAERIAEKIFSTILQTKPDLVLDLHNDWRKSIPYVLLDPDKNIKNKEVYEKAKSYGEKIGFPLILDTDEIEHSLTYNLLKENIPALSIELGESFVVNEKDVDNGAKAILNLLHNIGIIEQDEIIHHHLEEELKNKLLVYSPQPTSSTSGIIRFLVKPGEIVKKEEPIAKVYNAFGKLLETLTAKQEGLVLGYSDSSVSFPGAPVMAFGIFSKSE